MKYNKHPRRSRRWQKLKARNSEAVLALHPEGKQIWGACFHNINWRSLTMSQMWLYWRTIWLNNSLQPWEEIQVKRFKDACSTAYSKNSSCFGSTPLRTPLYRFKRPKYILPRYPPRVYKILLRLYLIKYIPRGRF